MNRWLGAVPVPLGEYAVARDEGRISALGLGSCVAVVLYDAGRRVGGVAHVVLPVRPPGRVSGPVARYAHDAVPLLAAEVERLGARPDGLTARLVGGACMFSSLMPPGRPRVGERNLVTCREALDRAGIPVVGEDAGAEHGRSVVFDVADGAVVVRAVHRGERHV